MSLIVFLLDFCSSLTNYILPRLLRSRQSILLPLCSISFRQPLASIDQLYNVDILLQRHARCGYASQYPRYCTIQLICSIKHICVSFAALSTFNDDHNIPRHLHSSCTPRRCPYHRRCRGTARLQRRTFTSSLYQCRHQRRRRE